MSKTKKRAKVSKRKIKEKEIIKSEKKGFIKTIFDLKPKLPKIKRIISKKRVPTGISGIDSLIQGGYKQGSINLVEGGPGSGKTIFVTQFLVDGLKRGEPVAYITFEVIKEKFYENMSQFGWDLEKYEKEGLFTFLVYSPEQIKTFLPLAIY